jgi:RNA polymerase sigma-70 factor (ECF subfamily)
VFYERHERAVLGFLMAATRRADGAADPTAETFATALEAVASYGPPRGSARVWLLGISRHVLAASARWGRVEPEARRRLGLEALVLEERQLEAIDALLERDGDGVVEEWPAELPREHAEALRARVLDERPYAEIAGALRCSEAVVRQRVSRGLGRLRRRLTEEAASPSCPSCATSSPRSRRPPSGGGGARPRSGRCSPRPPRRRR